MADSSQDTENPQKVEEDRERIRELNEKGKEQYEVHKRLQEYN